MSSLTNQPTTSTPPSGDDNSFKRKLINFIIAALLILLEIVKYYHWPYVESPIGSLIWVLELIALLL